jgi:RNA polymerase sigma-70 factor (ECF subfamily)
MQGVLEGDDEAFAHLVGRHERALFNYLVRMVQDEAMAADLMQETWLRVFQNAFRYDTSRKFTTWLYTIAYHCCLDALRLRRRLERSAQQAPRAEARHAQSPPHEQLLAHERLTAVHRAVQDLPELHRTVFLLRHYHGLSYQDISAIVQCPLGTVKSRLYHAVRQLQKALRTWGEGDKRAATEQGRE